VQVTQRRSSWAKSGRAAGEQETQDRLIFYQLSGVCWQGRDGGRMNREFRRYRSISAITLPPTRVHARSGFYGHGFEMSACGEDSSFTSFGRDELCSNSVLSHRSDAGLVGDASSSTPRCRCASPTRARAGSASTSPRDAEWGERFFLPSDYPYAMSLALRARCRPPM